MKKVLAGIPKDGITFSTHFTHMSMIRKITETEIRDKIDSPHDLLEVDDLGIEYGGHKYALIFRKLSNYVLRVVVAVKSEKLIIITAYIVNVKKKKAYKKWLDTQK